MYNTFVNDNYNDKRLINSTEASYAGGHSSFKQTQPHKNLSERPPGHVWLYNGNEQPLNKGHPYITTNPGGVPL